MISLLRQTNALLSRIPADLVLLGLRVFPALVFWVSGQTKVDGFAIAPSTWYLFETDFALPLLPPGAAAVLTVVAEHLFPILLILGLFTRLSALALIAMTAVIQLFIFPGAWVTHGTWVAPLLAVAAFGPGRWSVDRQAGLDPADVR